MSVSVLIDTDFFVLKKSLQKHSVKTSSSSTQTKRLCWYYAGDTELDATDFLKSNSKHTNLFGESQSLVLVYGFFEQLPTPRTRFLLWIKKQQPIINLFVAVASRTPVFILFVASEYWQSVFIVTELKKYLPSNVVFKTSSIKTSGVWQKLICHYAQQQQVTITSTAIQTLLNTRPHSGYYYWNTVMRLALGFPRIDSEVVQQNTIPIYETNVFMLTECLLNNSGRKFIVLLRQLLNNNAHTMVLLSFLGFLAKKIYELQRKLILNKISLSLNLRQLHILLTRVQQLDYQFKTKSWYEYDKMVTWVKCLSLFAIWKKSN